MPPDEVTDRIDNVIPNIFHERIHKWCANILDPTLNPHIVVEEVSLARQNTEVHREAVVLAVNDGEKAIFYFLSDVQDSREIHQSLIVLAELTNTSDEEAFVGFEQFLEHDG